MFAEWQRDLGPQGLQVLGASMDDDRADAQRAAAKLKLKYPVFLADEHMAGAYGGVMGLPVTFLIDRRGRIRRRYDGGAPPQMRAEVEALLRER